MADNKDEYIKKLERVSNLTQEEAKRELLAELEKEKGVIVEEMNMYQDTPMRHIGDVFDQVLLDKRLLTDEDAVNSLYLDYGYLFSELNPRLQPLPFLIAHYQPRTR